jgi:hypothetical protein
MVVEPMVINSQLAIVVAYKRIRKISITRPHSILRGCLKAYTLHHMITVILLKEILLPNAHCSNCDESSYRMLLNLLAERSQIPH